jgi:F0F1-type ATP synthase assembly protein I
MAAIEQSGRSDQMASKLVWGILGGVVVGAALGAAAGNTAIGIAICVAVGAVAAGVWQYFDSRGVSS